MNKTKILLAEDDAFLARVYESFFIDEGYEIMRVANGRETLEALNSEAPGVLILDLLMPEMSGFDVLEARRNSAALLQVPVIVLTSMEDVATIARVKELGANDYFDKNTTELEPLLAKVRQYTTV
jgi:DNA-binding response OmpR family regulator